MPSWKRVIVSGSDARLNSLTVDGGVTASRFNGGTFSGSFSGDGSGLTGIVASATPGGPNQSIQYNNAGTTSGSSMFRFETGTNTVFVTGSINATSVTASFLGNVTGTASWAVSASWAPGADSVSASYATTSSYALNADNFQINTSIITTNTHNYDPTGFHDAKVVYLCFSSGSKAITGFASGSGGMVKWFINTGSWMGYVPFEHPSSSAANRVMGSSDYLIPPGGVIHGLYDAGASRWRITYSSFDLSDMVLTGKGMYYNQYPGSTNASDHPFLGLAVAGTGATNANATPSSNLPSAWDLDSGTTAAGDSTVYLIKNQLVIDSLGYAHIGAWTMVFIPTLSNGTQRFRAHFNVLTGASSTVEHVANSFGIRYCDNSSSGAWECFSRDNSSAEFTQSSGITVAANTLYLLKVFAPIDLSEIRFHVSNGTSAFNTVLTNNLPTVGTTVGVRTSIHKVVGATARNLRVCNIGGYAVRG